MAGPFQPIGAPPASPPRVGLLAVVGGESAELTLDAGWEGGIALEPERCLPSSNPAWGDCPEPGGSDPRTDPGSKAIGDAEALVQYRPWTAWVGDKCSTLSGQGRDPVARAQRLYRASESRVMEAELWAGAEARRRFYPNNFLANSAAPNFEDLTPGGSSPGTYALAALQEAIALGQTGRGMIHATWPTVSLWFSLSALRREGGLILDVFDNIVVAGTGYDGSGPCVPQIDSIAVDATGGTWALTVDGNTVGATLAFDITAGALEALAEVLVPGTTVSGGPGDLGGTTPYVITWGDCFAHVVATDPALLTGGAMTADVTQTQAAGPTPVDPTGETSWAYATGIVQTKRAASTQLVPSDLAEAVRLDTNDEEWRVERVVAAWWDGCVQAAANVNLCSTCCEPAP